MITKGLTVNLCALLSLTLPLTVAAAEYPDPERFRAAIDAFNAEADVPRGAVVATGPRVCEAGTDGLKKIWHL